MLIIIVPTSCSKEDDPYHIDKTYAADDFVKTDRNIREKLVGKWLIEQMKVGHTTYSAQDLGSGHNAWFRADGTCDFLSLAEARWSVEDLRVTITYLDEEEHQRKTLGTFGVGTFDAWHITLTSTSRTIKLYHQ
jgi:hypothetical protein